jgi:hypothetical protein
MHLIEIDIKRISEVRILCILITTRSVACDWTQFHVVNSLEIQIQFNGQFSWFSNV